MLRTGTHADFSLITQRYVHLADGALRNTANIANNMAGNFGMENKE